MIEGIETLYQQIADSIVDAIQEPWSVVTMEAIFYTDSIDFDAEYTRETGQVASFGINLATSRVFRALRKQFKEAGQPVWGQARFELRADGKFNMTFGYENCDEKGDTIFDAEKWHQRQAERRKRLTSM